MEEKAYDKLKIRSQGTSDVVTIPKRHKEFMGFKTGDTILMEVEKTKEGIKRIYIMKK